MFRGCCLLPRGPFMPVERLQGGSQIADSWFTGVGPVQDVQDVASWGVGYTGTCEARTGSMGPLTSGGTGLPDFSERD